MTKKEPARLEWTVAELRNAVQAAGVALWTWSVEADTFVMDASAYDMWDVATGGYLTFEVLSTKIHPADRDRVRTAFAATRAIDGPFEIDFRILTEADQVRWISARGQGNASDITAEKMTGIFLDVTGRKQAEEGHELLAGEMSHRVKNLLALASGLTAITSRSTETKEEMSRQLTERLTALDHCPMDREEQHSWGTYSQYYSLHMMTKALLPVAYALRFPAWDWAKNPPRASHWLSMNWQQTL